MKRSMSVFLACAIGAGIGSLVALEIAHAFWWVGLVVGLATGYLTYEIKAVGWAIVSAWRAVFGWRPSPVFRKKLIFAFVTGSFSVCWVALLIIYHNLTDGLNFQGIISSVLHTLTFVNPLLAIFVACIVLLGSVAPVMIIGGMALIFGLICVYSPFEGSDEQFDGPGLIMVSPPAVIFVWLPIGIWLCLKKIPAAIAAIGRLVAGIPRFVCHLVLLSADFIWLVFLAIHSEVRLLCGVDAMLGAAIGYYAGSAVIGAIAGGILGVINYALITERVLKPRGLV